MKNPINFFDAELINNEWWFSNLNFNALMKMNSESGETEMISTFEGIPLDEENLHIKTIISGDLLFFIPRYKNIIHIWNTKENHFEKSVVIDCEKSGFFINALKDNNDIIWIIPSKLSDPVIIFDINKRKISSLDITKEIADSENSGAVVIWGDYNNNHIYIQLDKKNICFSVDCNSKKVEKIVFPDRFIGLPFSAYDNKLYLSLYGTTDIFEWDTETKTYVRYEIDNELKRGLYPYSDIIKTENRLVIAPCHTDNVVVYDIENNEYEKLVFPEGFERTWPYNMSGFYRIKGNEICIFPLCCNQLIKVNTDNFTLSTLPILLSDSLKKYSDDMINGIFEKHYHSEINEDFAYKETMDMFIDKLVSEEIVDKKNNDDNAGEKIHNYIVSLFK